jgi:hypothetical protein
VRRYFQFLLVVFVCLSLVGCGTRSAEAAAPASSQVTASTISIQQLFTRTGYNYGPAIIQEGGVRQLWWCGNGNIPGTTFQTDVIYYRTMDTSNSSMSPISMVFWPQPGQWDGQFTCDPSVVRGQFNADGQSYSYALYYTGTDIPTGNNRIGVAFSNDGINWHRYSQNPLVMPQTSPASTYGAGQPASYNRDGVSNVSLFYTDDSVPQYGLRMWTVTSTDAIHFGPPTLLSTAGATLNANSDFAYDAASGEFYAAMGIPGRPGDRDTYGFSLARMPATQLMSGAGTWELLTTIDTRVTGAQLNHSPGLVRDRYGNMVSTSTVETFFTEGTNAPASWNLFSAKWTVH